jgi:AraC-like DNA-binding protein
MKPTENHPTSNHDSRAAVYQEFLADSSNQITSPLTTTEEVRHFLGSAPHPALNRCVILNSLTNVVKQPNTPNHFTIVLPINNSILIESMGEISLIEPGCAVLFWPNKERHICILYFGTLDKKCISELSLVRDHPSLFLGAHIYSQHDATLGNQRLEFQRSLPDSAKLEQIFLDALMTPHLTPKASFSPKFQHPPEHLGSLKDTLNQIWNDPFFSWDLATCSEISGFSPFHFSRIISQFTGLGLRAFVEKSRARSFAYRALNRQSHTDQSIDQCNLSQLGVRKILRLHTDFSAADLNYARRKLLNLSQTIKP